MAKKLPLLFVLMLYFLAMPVAAETPASQTPVTANTIEGQVKGVLSDKTEVSLDPRSSRTPSLEGRSALSVSFCTEVTRQESILINGRYITIPRVYCSTPDRKLHLSGKRARTAITMTPDMAGEWRWSGDYELVFRPKKPWPVAQNYQLKFDNTIFPEQVVLKNGSYSVTTEALTPKITNMEFFQDPNTVEKKGVTTTIAFNSPVAAEELKKHLVFTLEELTEEIAPNKRKVIAKAEKLPFDLKMNVNGTEAVVTTPLKALPDKERWLRVNVTTGLNAKAGGKPFAEDKSEPHRFEQRVQVPSRYSYAQIKSVEARIIKNDRFEPEQVLIITTNVPVTNEELSKHLSLHQLPKDKPASSSAYSPKKDYAWTSSYEVTDDLLKKSPAVPFTVQPTADAFSTLHSIKLDTEAGRWLYVRITKGMNAKNEYVLERNHSDTVLVPEYSKEVRLLSDGALLSLSGEKKVSVYSLGAQKLRYEVRRVITNDISHFLSQSQGNFENPDFKNWAFSEHNLSEAFGEDVTLPPSDARKPQFSAFDFTPYLAKNPDAKGTFFKDAPHGKGLFFLTINAIALDNNGKEAVVSTDKRFILVSDLGLIVKTNIDGTQEAFVQSVKTGEPVAGAAVEVLSTNGLNVLELKTDGRGHVTIPNLVGFTNEKEPVAYVVKKGDDLSFMPYRRGDRSLDYSKFETDGIHADEQGLKAFLFSDRGIYRPSEEVRLGIVVKQGDWAQNLEGLPLRLEITNPRGQVVDTSLIKLNAVGFVDYRFATKETSATGVYPKWRTCHSYFSKWREIPEDVSESTLQRCLKKIGGYDSHQKSATRKDQLCDY